MMYILYSIYHIQKHKYKEGANNVSCKITGKFFTVGTCNKSCNLCSLYTSIAVLRIHPKF